MNAVSIDKLNLVLPDSEFQIPMLTDAMKVKHRTHPMSEQVNLDNEYLLTTKDGHPVHGQAMFGNTPNVQVTISKRKDGTLGMLIGTNPNKWHHPFNASNDPAEYARFRSGLNDELKSLGIDCNLPGAQIHRIDLAKQKQMSSPLYSYHQVFDSIHARRQMDTRFMDTIRIGNQQRQAVIYDKQKELGLPLEHKDLVRLETRFLKSETSSKYTGLKSLSDLDRNISSDGFHHLNQVYCSYLNDEVFRYIRDKREQVRSIAEQAKAIAKDHPNKVLSELITANGIVSTIQEAGGIAPLAQIVTNARIFTSDESQQRYFRRVRSDIETRLDRAMSIISPQNRTFVDLFDEIASFALAS